MSEISKRQYFAHPAHNSVGVLAHPATFPIVRLLDMAAPAAPAEPARSLLHVCLVSGAPESRSDRALAAFGEYLEGRFAVQCRRAFCTAEDVLPGTEHLATSDCMLLCTRRMPVDGEPLARIRRYCRRGGALVAVRAGDHAFRNWPEFDREVLGVDCRVPFGNPGQREVHPVDATRDHPILQGVEPFRASGNLVRSVNLAPDATVLLTGTIRGHAEPVAWTRPHRSGRVFGTSLGELADFRQESFRRLLANAVHWTAKGGQAVNSE